MPAGHQNWIFEMAEKDSSSAKNLPAKRQRGKRATRVGVVTSAVRDKTIGVTVSQRTRYPKYGKYMSQRAILHAHDEQNQAGKGDLVEIVECRPMSKTKSWRVVAVNGESTAATEAPEA